MRYRTDPSVLNHFPNYKHCIYFVVNYSHVFTHLSHMDPSVIIVSHVRAMYRRCRLHHRRIRSAIFLDLRTVQFRQPPHTHIHKHVTSLYRKSTSKSGQLLNMFTYLNRVKCDSIRKNSVITSAESETRFITNWAGYPLCSLPQGRS